MEILMVLLAFNFIIIIHELGHFVVAKLSRIKVEEFSLFVGPKIFSFKKGETTYSLRTFPILAYVKMEGEDEKSDSERAFYKKPVWVRASVIAAGPLANLVSAFILIAVFYGVVGYGTTNVGDVVEGSPAHQVGIRKGDKVIGYDYKRVYQPMEVFQFLYVSKGKPTEIEILRNGEKIETQINPQKVSEAESFKIGFEPVDQGENSNVVKNLSPNYPGKEAGLEPGDRIVKLNDTEVSSFEEIKAFLDQNKDKPISVTVERQGTRKILNMTPKKEVIPEQYKIGLQFTGEKGNLLQVINNAALFTYSNSRMVPFTLAWLITGKVSITQMVGPVGIVDTMSDVVQESPTFMDKLLNILQLTAYISAAIGATNLIPFPALDGSKLLLLGVEAVRRKPIPIEKEAIIMTIGFFILIGFSIFVMSNDILRVFSQ